jgi:preprotein translocase SecE subunit
MSVAENPTTEQMTQNPQQELAVGSFAGAAALLVGLLLVFATLPWYWHAAWAAVWADPAHEALRKNVYLADALLVLLEIGLVGVLVYGAYMALQKYTLPGLRAGIFFAAIYLFFAMLLVGWLGGQLDHPGSPFEENGFVGFVVLVVVLAILVALAGYVYLMVPGWRNLLETIEAQGWFHGISYKGNQGVRVRRGTIVGILAVGVFGIATMVTNRFFGSERPELANDWYWTVPFTNPVQYAFLMFKVHLIMPIVLGILLIWVAWRIVNVPVFADFLIATEAEMNKVSWTTRKRLLQDTVVVLVTVFLFTSFLFVVDIIWIKVLSAPYIQVLLIDPREQAQKQQEVAKW